MENFMTDTPSNLAIVPGKTFVAKGEVTAPPKHRQLTPIQWWKEPQRTARGFVGKSDPALNITIGQPLVLV
jgi:hypothetical protein